MVIVPFLAIALSACDIVVPPPPIPEGIPQQQCALPIQPGNCTAPNPEPTDDGQASEEDEQELDVGYSDILLETLKNASNGWRRLCFVRNGAQFCFPAHIGWACKDFGNAIGFTGQEDADFQNIEDAVLAVRIALQQNGNNVTDITLQGMDFQNTENIDKNAYQQAVRDCIQNGFSYVCGNDQNCPNGNVCDNGQCVPPPPPPP